MRESGEESENESDRERERESEHDMTSVSVKNKGATGYMNSFMQGIVKMAH